ncbi:hypothetical protein TNCV_3231661 [Trichonephila clavipes]|nr:hypothetical protein TNCV_3231661 [Trichonephila clavipes]
MKAEVFSHEGVNRLQDQLLLLYGQTLNSDIYCQRLDRLKLAIDQKRPELANRRGVVLHQDNARPHTSIRDSPETLGAWLESFNASTI